MRQSSQARNRSTSSIQRSAFFATLSRPSTPKQDDRKNREPKKEDPGARRARVCRRMGEGLGAGGHSTRRCLNNDGPAQGFLQEAIIFGLAHGGRVGGGACGCSGAPAYGSVRPDRPEGRRADRREIPGTANGCEEAPALRHGPRSHSAFRPGSGRGDHLQANPNLQVNLCNPHPYDPPGTFRTQRSMPKRCNGSETPKRKAGDCCELLWTAAQTKAFEA
jgi:hypothetical protein